MKLSKLLCAGLLLICSTSVLAKLPTSTQVQVRGRQILVKITDQTDAKVLFDTMRVEAHSADQGLMKYFEAKGPQDSLTLVCNLDHRNSCTLTYVSAPEKKLFPAGDDTALFGASKEISAKLYALLDLRPTSGSQALRKFFMTTDNRLQLDCSSPTNAEPRCIFEIIR